MNIYQKENKDFMSTIINTITKNANNILSEKLSPEEEQEVDRNWKKDRPENTEAAIRNVFGNKQRIELPFHVGSVEPHPELEDHLNQNGYKITDYLLGKAKDKYNRETNIGKALVKTGAPDHIKALFDHDPDRQQQASKMKIVISHKPSDVAGMTSCGHSWEDVSCMNFKTGSNRDYLKHDITQGTHVAYLTTDDDKDLDKPLARIAVKPFHEYDSGENHTIFRPENRSYGATPAGFSKHVFDWFSKPYPANTDTNYIKNEHVYDDDQQDTYREYSPDMLESKINSAFREDHNFSGRMTEENQNHIINRVKNASKEEMDNFAFGYHEGVWNGMNRNHVNELYNAAKNVGSNAMMNSIRRNKGGDLSIRNVKHTLESGKEPTKTMVGQRYFPKEELKKLHVNFLNHTHPKNMTSDVLDHIIDRNINGENRMFGIINDNKNNISKDGLKKMINHVIGEVSPSRMVDMINAKNANDDVFDHAENAIRGSEFMDKEHFLNVLAGNHKNPKPKHVAMVNDVFMLNNVMSNAKDKFTHNLALHKALGMGNAKDMDIQIRNPKANEYIGDNEITELNKKYNLLDYRPHTMPHGVFSRLLDIDDHKIHSLTDKVDSGDEHSRIGLREAMLDHARKLNFRMNEHRRLLENDMPIDKHEHFENLGRLERIQEHKYYSFTHEPVMKVSNYINKELIE